jgi:hypothetical protein
MTCSAAASLAAEHVMRAGADYLLRLNSVGEGLSLSFPLDDTEPSRIRKANGRD